MFRMIFRETDIGKVFVGKCALWRTVARFAFDVSPGYGQDLFCILGDALEYYSEKMPWSDKCIMWICKHAY